VIFTATDNTCPEPSLARAAANACSTALSIRVGDHNSGVDKDNQNAFCEDENRAGCGE
jgi:hypothetical protein